MAFQALCSVPFVVLAGQAPVCPGDAWSVIEVTAFSWETIDSAALVSKFAEGFAVMVPVVAAIYGVRLVWSLIRSA